MKSRVVEKKFPGDKKVMDWYPYHTPILFMKL